MVKEDKLKVEGGAKPKGSHFPKPTSTRKEHFKGITYGLEDKVFNFFKQNYVTEFSKNCEAISEFIAVKYKHDGIEIDMTTKNMEKANINVPKIPEDIPKRVEIFI